MNTNVPAINPFKAWLNELLLNRELFKGPNGRPLYSYQLSESEYASLRDLLKLHLRRSDNPAHLQHLSACFCLFVSEQYRRNYNRSWSWAGAEAELGVLLSPADHATLTQKGLDYWLRPVRRRENGRDWLGTLFAEGGLPWPLVQDDKHGFGRAVKRGIKHFFRTEGNRRTTSDLMADFEEDLPLAFRTLETRQLLAGIVDQLMYLVEHYPLKDQQDPASYLDKVAPYWSGEFPIPLDETNARRLINDWLRDAGQKRQERKEVLERAREFTCEHVLQGVLPAWAIRTELILPQHATFKIDLTQLSSTRLDIAYYEGEHILARGGAVYGQLSGDNLQVRFSNTQVTLERRHVSEPVTLRLLDNGRVVHRFKFEDSALDFQYSPLVFERRVERWQLAGTSSCSLSGNKALIRLPSGFELNAELEAPTNIGLDRDAGHWVEVTADISLHYKDDVYRIELNQAQEEALKPALIGNQAQYDSNPSTIFLGWPSLDLPEGFTYGRDELVEFGNGLPLDALRRSGFHGLVRYSLRSKSGKTLLQRRFAVLPREFSLGLSPGIQGQPARITLKSAQQLDCRIVSDSLKCQRLSDVQEKVFFLQHDSQKPPASFVLELGTGGSQQPMQVRLPYPYQGARLLDTDLQPTSSRELSLSELLGHRVALASGQPQGQSFFLVLELVSESALRPQRVYEVRVGQDPVQLSLYSYQNDILQMLGAVDEQDAFIKLHVETEQRLLSLNIRRYNGRLAWQGRDIFAICDIGSSNVLDAARVEAMLMSDPKQAPLVLAERTSQDVGTGLFEIPNALQRRGPWLIYPAQDSSIQFRPALYVSNTQDIDMAGEVCSLHRATEVFHPEHNPEVINQQIAAMAEDFGHSGWQYLADLKQYFAHLPLSSFESWKALSHHPRAMALAVLRLEMDEAFCNRVRDELAVIWEATSLRLWAEVYQYFLRSLHDLGLPQVLIRNLEENRASVLRAVVSGFDHVDDYLHTGKCASLTKVPPEAALPIWCGQLRQVHGSNRRWPTELSSELGTWISRQELPAQLKTLSAVGYANAVIYLPIFMAFVTAEKARLNDLGVPLPYLKFAVRLLADFDRQNWFNPAHALMVSYLLATQSEA
ncbi:MULTISPECIES: STY4851/ECs_5259 family protein [unclassified Pseudomonas]|uniref:STY4851/ECs_5259 family protein n=1 Tax=unclassified Pseudomonas TaxID=196821 RepID=UPI0021BA600D|nr:MULTISPECIES: STY4851/ECs_5259 family protein [unclassified Pseudomonas]MCT8165479.1 STY4851/ECs_5259 family protein [Pseudomonas sp. HD6422]MCT8184565.1 STY4851/ECs_5259 family protein [Pseudomonas sp. HD6421]